MPTRITATELARGLGGVLRRILSAGESFQIERNGALVARMGQHPEMAGLELFLVPIGPDAHGMRYQAVFT